MATTRRRFSPAFKDEAVRLVTEAGVSVAQAARDLDVHENVLRKWVRASQQSKPSSEQAHFAEQSELEQLRRENRRLRMERDILKNVWSAPVAQGQYSISTKSFASMYPAC